MTMRPYVIRQGDYMTQLAHRLGFDETEVWNHDKNSALKAELAKTKDELAKVKAELDEIIAAQVDDGARNARGNRSRVAGRQRRARRQCQ